MDQPDASKTRSTGATVFICRGSRRVQTSSSSTFIHGRVARSLTLTNHRVPADDTSTTPSTVSIRLRPLRSRKRQLRWTNRTVHTIHILHSSRTLGRILRKHARASLRLSLPDHPPTILKVALSNKILCDVRSLNSALPNTSLDLGPHSHRGSSLRTLALERDTPLNPPQINSWNPHRWRSSRCPEEHYVRDPFSSR